MRDKRRQVYQSIKQELKQAAGNARYFTIEFFNEYIAAKKAMHENAKKGINDHYEKNGIIYLRSFDSVYNSKFYQKNGSVYCLFLEIAYRDNQAILAL